MQAQAYVFDQSNGPWTFPRESSAYQYGYIELDILNPGGATVQTTNVVIKNSDYHGPLSFDFGTASWSATLPVRERCTIGDLIEVDPSSVTTIDGTDFPTFNGLAAQGDGPPASYCTFTEEPTGSLVLQISAGGLSLTQTVSSTGLAWSYQVFREVYVAELNHATSANVAGQMNGYPLAGDLTYGGGVFLVDEAGGQTVNAPDTTDPSPHGYLLRSSTQVPLEYDLNARLRSFADPFPGGGTLHWLATASGYQPLSGSSVSAITKQRNYQAYCEIDNVLQNSTAATETGWMRVYATNTGDDSRDWRCAIHGKPFYSFTLSQDANTAVASGGVYTTTTSFTPSVQNWEGYRYLRFTADQSGTLTITNSAGDSKAFGWTVAIPGTAQTITLDLCSPTTWSVEPLPAVDSRTGRWPLVNPSTGPTGHPDEGSTIAAANKGVYAGIFWAASCQASGFSGTLHLGALSLIRNQNSFATFLPKFLPDYYGWKDSAAKTYYLAPFLTLESDGKLVADWPAGLHILPLSGSKSFSQYQLTDLIGFINSSPGWHAIAATSFPPDGYHNNSLLAWTAFGSGAVYRSGLWTEGVDVSVGSSGINIYAQTLFDQVQGYPLIGNAWEAADYSGPPGLPINVTKHWRGQAAGLVLNTDGTPLAGAQIKTLNPSPTGSGTADSQGAYKTGPSYGPAPIDTTTELAAGTPSDHKPWANRWRVRDSFRATLTGERQPWNLVTPPGDYHRASISAGGDIVYRSAPLAGNDWAVQTTLTSSGNWGWPRMVRDPLSRIELRAIQSGQGAYGFISDDEGATWSSPTLLNMSAILCDIRISFDGTLLETSFIPNSGTSGPGTFSMRVRRAGDSAWSSPFVPLDDTGANLASDGSGFAVEHALEGPDRWILTMVKAGETTASDWWSADDGATWKRFS